MKYFYFPIYGALPAVMQQVFGHLLTVQPAESVDEADGGTADGEKEEEVREQMADIFSGKSKLSGLQKQVK